MATDKLTVGFVGVGAVGTVMATCLAEAGARVVVADIPERIAQIQERGLGMHWEERHRAHEVETVGSIRELASAHPDCIMVATKAYVLPRIMPEVADAAGKDCLVISAENGIETEAELARFIPPANVARMVINFAAGLDEAGFARVVWFNPPNAFGALTDEERPALEQLVALLNAAGLNSEIVDTTTIKKRAFLKTILTSALMPLCAILGLTMKEAMTGKATRQIAGDVVREGLAVARRLGYEYGEGIWEQCMGYLDKGGSHHPSMSVDLRNKRPTEIEFINGKLLEVGSQFAELTLEVNRVLVGMLMTQEVRNGTRAPHDLPAYLQPMPKATAAAAATEKG
jgi:2-dehydropantoate 2-reductase